MSAQVKKIGPSQSGIGSLMNSGAAKIGKIGLAAYTGGATAAGTTAIAQTKSPAGRVAGAYQAGQSVFGGPAKSPGMDNSNSSAYDPQKFSLGSDAMQFQTDPSFDQPTSLLMPGQGNGQILGNNDQLDAMTRRMLMAQGYNAKGF